MDEQVIKPNMGFVPSNKPFTKKQLPEPPKPAPTTVNNFFINIDPMAVMLVVALAVIFVLIFKSDGLA